MSYNQFRNHLLFVWLDGASILVPSVRKESIIIIFILQSRKPETLSGTHHVPKELSSLNSTLWELHVTIFMSWVNVSFSQISEWEDGKLPLQRKSDFIFLIPMLPPRNCTWRSILLRLVDTWQSLWIKLTYTNLSINWFTSVEQVSIENFLCAGHHGRGLDWRIHKVSQCSG